jgi:hypothetical protein
MFGHHDVTGKVVDKKHYPAVPPTPEAIHGTGRAAFIGPAFQGDPDGWSLIIQDATGKHHEKYVSEMDYNNTEKGDQWPPTPTA